MVSQPARGEGEGVVASQAEMHSLVVLFWYSWRGDRGWVGHFMEQDIRLTTAVWTVLFVSERSMSEDDVVVRTDVFVNDEAVFQRNSCSVGSLFPTW